MFILKDHRRINLSKLKEYKPIEKDEKYFIEFTYDDNLKEEFVFDKDMAARNKMIDTIDKTCLNLISFIGGNK